MDTLLHPRWTQRARRWLGRVAALALLGGTGCLQFNDIPKSVVTPPGQTVAQSSSAKPATEPGVVQAKADGGPFEWPDWEWSDFDLFGIFPKAAPDVTPSDAVVLQGDSNTPVKAPPLDTLKAKMTLGHERFDAKDYARAEKIFHR